MKKFLSSLLVVLAALSTFGQTKISALTEYTNPGDAGFIPVVVGGVTYKTLPTNLLFTTLAAKAGLTTNAFTGRQDITLITEQSRVAYDASNYLSTTVGSTGSTTFDLTGTSPTFTFGKAIVINSASFQNASTSTSATIFAANQFSTTTNAGVIFGTSSQVKNRAWYNGSATVALAANDGYANLVIGNSGGVTGASSGTHGQAANLVVKGFTFTPNATTPATLTRAAAIWVDAAATGATNNYGVYSLAKDGFDATMTAGGTTGNQTINKPSGSVNIAAGQSTVTVTNSTVTASSIVMVVLMTNDATARDGMACVVSSGSFVITLDAATTAECKIGFIVYN